MAEGIEIVVNARDNASGPLRSINGALGQMQTAVNGSGKAMDSAMAKTKNFGSSVEKSIPLVSGLGNALGKLGLASLGINALVSSARGLSGIFGIKAASDFNETINKIEVVFGDASDAIKEWSKTSAQSLGQSRNQALAAAGTFGNLFVTMGLGPKAAGDMSMGLVELASDIGSFQNLEPEVVLEKLRSGLVGEVEPLRSVGILLNETNVKAKAMAMGLASGTGELTEAAKVQARYALILEQSSTAQGDFSKTASGMANASRVIKASLANIQIEIGQRLLPVVAPLVASFAKALPNAMKFIEPIAERVGATLAGLVRNITGFASSIGNLVRMMSSGDFRGGIFGLSEDHPAIRGLLAMRNVLLRVADGISGLFSAFQGGGVIGVIGQIGDAIRNGLASLPQLLPQLQAKIRDLIGGLFKNLDPSGAVQGVGNFLQQVLNTVLSIIPQLPNLVTFAVGIATSIFTALRDAVGSIDWASVFAAIASVGQSLLNTFRNVDWGGVARSILDGIMDAVSSVDWGSIWALIQEAFRSRIALAMDWGDALINALGNILNEVIDWIQSAVTPIVQTFFSTWLPAFTDWVREIVRTITPRLLNMLTNIINWIIQAAPRLLETFISEWLPAFLVWVVRTVPLLLFELGKLLVSIGAWIVTIGVPKIIELAIQLGIALVKGIAKGLLNLAGELFSLGVEIVKNIGSGIASIAGAIFKPIVDTWNTIASKLSLPTITLNVTATGLSAAIADVDRLAASTGAASNSAQSITIAYEELQDSASGSVGTLSAEMIAFDNELIDSEKLVKSLDKSLESFGDGGEESMRQLGFAAQTLQAGLDRTTNPQAARVLQGALAGVQAQITAAGNAANLTAGAADKMAGAYRGAGAAAAGIPPPGKDMGKKALEEAEKAARNLERQIQGIADMPLFGTTAASDEMFRLEQQSKNLELALLKLGEPARQALVPLMEQSRELEKRLAEIGGSGAEGAEPLIKALDAIKAKIEIMKLAGEGAAGPLENSIESLQKQMQILRLETETANEPLERMFERLAKPVTELTAQQKLDAFLALGATTVGDIEAAASAMGLITGNATILKGVDLGGNLGIVRSNWLELRDASGDYLARIQTSAQTMSSAVVPSVEKLGDQWIATNKEGPGKYIDLINQINDEDFAIVPTIEVGPVEEAFGNMVAAIGEPIVMTVTPPELPTWEPVTINVLMHLEDIPEITAPTVLPVPISFDVAEPNIPVPAPVNVPLSVGAFPTLPEPPSASVPVAFAVPELNLEQPAPLTVPVTYAVAAPSLLELEPVIIPIAYALSAPELPAFEAVSIPLRYLVEMPELPAFEAQTVAVAYALEVPEWPVFEPMRVPVTYDVAPVNFPAFAPLTVPVGFDVSPLMLPDTGAFLVSVRFAVTEPPPLPDLEPIVVSVAFSIGSLELPVLVPIAIPVDFEVEALTLPQPEPQVVSLSFIVSAPELPTLDELIVPINYAVATLTLPTPESLQVTIAYALEDLPTLPELAPLIIQASYEVESPALPEFLPVTIPVSYALNLPEWPNFAPMTILVEYALAPPPSLPAFEAIAVLVGFNVKPLVLPDLEPLSVPVGFAVADLVLPTLEPLIAIVNFSVAVIELPQPEPLLAPVIFALGELELPTPAPIMVNVGFSLGELPALPAPSIVIPVSYVAEPPELLTFPPVSIPFTYAIQAPELPVFEAQTIAVVYELVALPTIPPIESLIVPVGFEIGIIALPDVGALTVPVGFVVAELILPEPERIMAYVWFDIADLELPTPEPVIATVTFQVDDLALPRPEAVTAMVGFEIAPLPEIPIPTAVAVPVGFTVDALELPTPEALLVEVGFSVGDLPDLQTPEALAVAVTFMTEELELPIPAPLIAQIGFSVPELELPTPELLTVMVAFEIADLELPAVLPLMVPVEFEISRDLDRILAIEPIEVIDVSLTEIAAEHIDEIAGHVMVIEDALPSIASNALAIADRAGDWLSSVRLISSQFAEIASAMTTLMTPMGAMEGVASRIVGEFAALPGYVAEARGQLQGYADLLNNIAAMPILQSSQVVGGAAIPMQHGGSAMAGQPYLVGEKGPELFVPRESGNIVPNGANGTSQDNRRVNIIINGNNANQIWNKANADPRIKENLRPRPRW